MRQILENERESLKKKINFIFLFLLTFGSAFIRSIFFGIYLNKLEKRIQLRILPASINKKGEMIMNPRATLLVTRAIKAIKSCKTKGQLETALNYAGLVLKRCSLTKDEYENIFLKFCEYATIKRTMFTYTNFSARFNWDIHWD